jgi:hypothetical protein
VLKHSTSTYGVFGRVIALLIWLHLGAQMTLYAAELNVVLARRLWPRTLLGPPTVPADEETLTALAKVEERHDTEQVKVEFKRSRAQELRTCEAGVVRPGQFDASCRSSSVCNSISPRSLARTAWTSCG